MVSVVLNVYRRPDMLERQIEAIKNQSVEIKSEDIHVWYNKSGIGQIYPKDEKIRTYICNWNTKFFGRFTIPLLIKTPFVAIFDDDMQPPKDWIQNCLDTIKKEEFNGILGGSGVLLNRKAYLPYNKVGWNGIHSIKAERVDLVGHAWFFRQEWIKYLWYEKPISWDNGEDIMFSFLAQKHGGINTFVPPHPDNAKNLWCTDPFVGNSVGSDKHASWRISNHLQVRNQIVAHCIDNGWETVRKIPK